jgi:hypothetical protein
MGMGKPGRRKVTSTEYKIAFIERVIAAREKAEISEKDMVARLAKMAGRPVQPDTYRKYETPHPKNGSFMPHDLIVPFCEITRTHVAMLFEGPIASQSGDPGPTSAKSSKEPRRPLREHPIRRHEKRRVGDSQNPAY